MNEHAELLVDEFLLHGFQVVLGKDRATHCTG